MSRFAVDPRWLVYLPPTMAPTATHQRDAEGFLEHPREAFAWYREAGIGQVVCEEKHMGSRAVVVVTRDDDAGLALHRFDQHGDRVGIDCLGQRVGVRIRNRHEPRRERPEPLARVGVGREADDRGRAAMEVVGEGDDLRPAGRHALDVVAPAPRDLDRSLDALGAALAAPGAGPPRAARRAARRTATPAPRRRRGRAPLAAPLGRDLGHIALHGELRSAAAFRVQG